ncbi:MAG: hypothetical protein GY856_35295 [bacterium]|nr:hypothetical protein [bacterium]
MGRFCQAQEALWAARDARVDVLLVNEHGARELGYASGELVGRSVLRAERPRMG